MILHCSILKPLSQPTCFEETQVKTEHHRMVKQVPKDSISIGLSKVTYHLIFQSFKIFGDNANFAPKKELTEDFY